MARRLINRLDPLTVRKLIGDPENDRAPTAGRHPDGWGLYLVVEPTGSARWSFLYRSRATGKRREMGLGSAVVVTLAKAREKAAQAREQLSNGVDPVAARRTLAAIPTFGEVADDVLAKKEGEFRSETAKARAKRALEHYCEPIRSLPVNQVDTDAVLSVLRPIWTAKPETATKARGYIEAVLNAAKARGLRDGENPALWKGHLDHLLPRTSRRVVNHHAAMNRDELPAFIADLRTREATSARALEFQILCASRPGEVLGALIADIDLKAGVWTTPGDRMKSGRVHRVPLSARALEIAREAMKENPGPYLFRGTKPGKPLSGPVSERLMARMKTLGVTAHGFRSTFRDWAGEVSTFPRELAEVALSHAVGDATERAYARGDALEKRRKLMEAWAKFCEPRTSGNVTTIRRGAA